MAWYIVLAIIIVILFVGIILKAITFTYVSDASPDTFTREVATSVQRKPTDRRMALNEGHLRYNIDTPAHEIYKSLKVPKETINQKGLDESHRIPNNAPKRKVQLNAFGDNQTFDFESPKRVKTTNILEAAQEPPLPPIFNSQKTGEPVEEFQTEIMTSPIVSPPQTPNLNTKPEELVQVEETIEQNKLVENVTNNEVKENETLEKIEEEVKPIENTEVNKEDSKENEIIDDSEKSIGIVPERPLESNIIPEIKISEYVQLPSLDEIPNLEPGEIDTALEEVKHEYNLNDVSEKYNNEKLVNDIVLYEPEPKSLPEKSPTIILDHPEFTKVKPKKASSLKLGGTKRKFKTKSLIL